MALKLSLKAEFHSHTDEDPCDSQYIKYSSKELIDHVHRKGFEVLSITTHDQITYSNELKEYAESKNILLIPGVEATIEGHHVLLINYQGPLNFKSLQDLKHIRDPNILIIAAHPYFPGSTTLGEKVEKNIDLFDAIEFCHFYHPWINFNKRGVSVAQKYNKPMIGTSDTHFLMQVGTTYSIVDADEKTPDAVVRAVKQHHVRYITRSLSFLEIFSILTKFRFSLLRP